MLRRVSPFGDLRIKAYVRLPEAYRSLSRPSSAPDAKAFPLRSYQLDLVGVGFCPRPLILKNYVQITEKFKFWLIVFYPLEFSTISLLFASSVACSSSSSLFSFQGAIF